MPGRGTPRFCSGRTRCSCRGSWPEFSHTWPNRCRPDTCRGCGFATRPGGVAFGPKVDSVRVSRPGSGRRRTLRHRPDSQASRRVSETVGRRQTTSPNSSRLGIDSPWSSKQRTTPAMVRMRRKVAKTRSIASLNLAVRMLDDSAQCIADQPRGQPQCQFTALGLVEQAGRQSCLGACAAPSRRSGPSSRGGGGRWAWRRRRSRHGRR